MPRALDEVAAALRPAASSYHTTRLVRSTRLARQFGLPVTPGRWRDIADRLGCVLPPLERDRPGLWRFPRACETVGDLAALVAAQHPGWEPPGACTEADWVEAQIFARVRDVLAGALNVDPEEVTRDARLGEDLGAG